MGYAVSVDGAGVAAVGSQLTRVADQVDEVGRAVMTALGRVGDAGGGAELSVAAAEAGRRWGAGMSVVADHGRDLGRATEGAALDYLAAEESLATVWGGARGAGGAR